MAGVWRRIDKDGNPLAYARRIMLRIYLSRWRCLRRRPVQQPLVEKAAAGDPFASVDIRDSLRRGLATIRSLRFRGLQALRDRFGADDPAGVEVHRGTH